MWRFYDSSGRVKQNTKPTISLVTSLPSSPVDGDEIILTDSLTAGTYQWHLRYVSARATNKWLFVGGTRLEAEVATSEATAASAYAALATAGPSITLPVAGDYFIEHGFQCDGFPTNNQTIYMSYDIGATGATDADSVQATQDTSTGGLSPGHRLKKKTGLTAVTLTAKYRTNGVSSKFAQRYIAATPIAIGG